MLLYKQQILLTRCIRNVFPKLLFPPVPASKFAIISSNSRNASDIGMWSSPDDTCSSGTLSLIHKASVGSGGVGKG